MQKKITSVLSSLIILLFLTPLSSFSQKYQALDLDHILKANNKSQMSSNSVDYEGIKSLVYDLHPTVYIEDQQVKNFDEDKPIKVEVYSNSINLLTTKNPLFNSVELLVFKSFDGHTSTQIDISGLQSFENLKFIYVECAANCSVSTIEKMFSNTGNIPVIYQITTPE